MTLPGPSTAPAPPVPDRDARPAAGGSARDGVAGARLLVRGHVQGTGFRPFVCRLARALDLRGRVRNTAHGVLIEVEGRAGDLVAFGTRLTTDAPAAARIEHVTSETAPAAGTTGFTIDASADAAAPQVRVARDHALCDACRREVAAPGGRRRGYAFTTCTACGPRYSVMHALPYDRAATAMRRFATCGACDAEYTRPADRRFHAQTNACPDCGPALALVDGGGRALADAATAIAGAAEALRRGAIVAVKGLGGFQLLARADSETAVARLRARKRRPAKPLAVMVPSLASAAAYGAIDSVEARLLASAESPIVLVERRAGDGPALAPAVAPRVATVGLFLPTTPLHHLLLAALGVPVVATSGNRSEEPLVIDEGAARARLGGIADVFLVHDRPIVRRLDDSVVRVIGGAPVTLRLARGYAPLPLPALESLAARAHAAPACPPVLAAGGHVKGALALWSGAQAVLAQHLGDLDHPETRAVFTEAAADLTALYGCRPHTLACDAHPDFFTTAWARAQGRPLVAVQHHHAHALACMTEHGLLDRAVLAVTWDGTGYGTDGTLWGGEILHARLDGCTRTASLLPLPLPGGEAAIRAPARTALGALVVLRGEQAVLADGDLLGRLGLARREAGVLAAMIRRGVNTPWTSSVGRLFDAVAALVLGAHAVSYEGEAAVWLEAVADRRVGDAYPFPCGAAAVTAGDPGVARGDWRPLVTAVLADLRRDVPPATIAARFHNALAAWAAAVAVSARLPDVVLSGGCFQNRLLAERTAAALAERGLRVHVHGAVPPGDGGLAVGQLAAAMAATIAAVSGR